MAGKWIVFWCPSNGRTLYRVGRKLREDEPFHGGNVEYSGEPTEDKVAAEALAKELNEKEA